MSSRSLQAVCEKGKKSSNRKVVVFRVLVVYLALNKNKGRNNILLAKK